MATRDLDAFVEGLRTSFEAARETGRNQALGAVSRLIDLDPDGRLRAITWGLRLPGARPDGTGDETLELPLLSLRPTTLPSVAELSVELDCEIREVWGRGPAGSTRLLLTVQRPGRVPGKGVHRLSIGFGGESGADGEIRIDGVPIGEIAGDARTSPPPTGAATTGRLRLALSPAESEAVLDVVGDGIRSRWHRARRLLAIGAAVLGLAAAAVAAGRFLPLPDRFVATIEPVVEMALRVMALLGALIRQGLGA